MCYRRRGPLWPMWIMACRGIGVVGGARERTAGHVDQGVEGKFLERRRLHDGRMM